MSSIQFRQAKTTDFQAIANLIVTQNQHPETHCIHSSDPSSSTEAVQQEMIKLAANQELYFAMASQDNEIIGAFGAEIDPELGRSWLRGPFVDKTQDWDKTATELLASLMNILPPSINRLDSFLNITHHQGNQFYLQHDFEQKQLVHVYTAKPMNDANKPTVYCQPLQQKFHSEFIALHDTIFPGTYYTGQQIIDRLNETEQVFVYIDEAVVQGYIYATVHKEANEGMIEFVGVNAEARGQGIGRKLLATAIRWLFEEKSTPQISLTVLDNLANARALYESVGFHLTYTGVNMRKILSEGAIE